MIKIDAHKIIDSLIFYQTDIHKPFPDGEGFFIPLLHFREPGTGFILKRRILIRFLMEEKNYIHDAYENLAHRVFEEMVVSPNTNAEQIQEVRVCIDEGLLLPDWMLDPADYAPIIQRTQDRHMKNYWIIMKKIAVKAQERSAMREEQ